MKIVYVYPTLATWGGVERILVDKMNQLSNLYNYDVYILTYNQGDHEVPYKLNERVRHIDLKVRTHTKYFFRGVKRLWKGFLLRRLLRRRLKNVLESISPHVIVTTTAGELSLLLKLKCDIPLVVESHGGYDHLVDFKNMTLWHRFNIFLIRKRLKKVDAIVSLTETDAKKWRKCYRNIFVIPNIAHLNPTNKYSSGINKHVIFVGRYSEQKGIPDLLSVWSKVNERHPDWQLDIYGEGFDQQKVKEDINSLNININLNNPVSDIHNRYINSSIFILSSKYEPFGLVIPEAMSCGLPVVSFEGDGPNYILSDGQDGFLIKGGNINGFVEKVCILIENEELRKQMGKNAIRSSKRFSATNIMPMWKSFFETL